jgi:Flp pilus assembly protein TadG
LTILHDKDGATAVEFAIVSPVFFMMLIGIVQLSIAYFHGTTMQWAVDRAMRRAMVDATITASEVEELVRNDTSAIGTPEISLSYSVDDSNEIAIAHVTANYEIPVHVLFVPEFTMPFFVEAYVPVPDA